MTEAVKDKEAREKALKDAAEFKANLAEFTARGAVMGEFTETFRRLLGALETSQTHEDSYTKRLRAEEEGIRKFRDIAASAAHDMEDVEAAREKYQGDAARAFEEARAASARMEEKRTEAAELRVRIEKLDAQLALGPGWTEDQEEKRGKLEETRERRARAIEAKGVELAAARTAVSALTAEVVAGQARAPRPRRRVDCAAVRPARMPAECLCAAACDGCGTLRIAACILHPVCLVPLLCAAAPRHAC
jgi:hypothetical protein